MTVRASTRSKGSLTSECLNTESQRTSPSSDGVHYLQLSLREATGYDPDPRGTGTNRSNPTQSRQLSGQRGELGAYTFAVGFRAGLRVRLVHLARGKGLAARLHLTPHRRQRTAWRRRAGGGWQTPPSATLRTSPSPGARRHGTEGAKVEPDGAQGEGTEASATAAEPESAVEAGKAALTY